MHPAELLGRGADDEHRHFTKVLGAQLDDARRLLLGVLEQLHPMVGEHFLRRTGACVQEAGHIELDRVVRLGQVGKLGLAPD